MFLSIDESPPAGRAGNQNLGQIERSEIRACTPKRFSAQARGVECMTCEYEQTMHTYLIFPPLQPGPSLNHATGVIFNSRSPFVHPYTPLRTFRFVVTVICYRNLCLFHNTGSVVCGGPAKRRGISWLCAVGASFCLDSFFFLFSHLRRKKEMIIRLAFIYKHIQDLIPCISEYIYYYLIENEIDILITSIIIL